MLNLCIMTNHFVNLGAFRNSDFIVFIIYQKITNQHKPLTNVTWRAIISYLNKSKVSDCNEQYQRV